MGDGVGEGVGESAVLGAAVGEDVTVRGVSGAGVAVVDVGVLGRGTGLPGVVVVDGRGEGAGEVTGVGGAHTGSTELRDSSSI